MNLRNRPLLPAGIDWDLYVPRPDLENALVDAVEDERNTLVLGPAGSGKTTLLRKLWSDQRGERPTAWVDGGAAETALDLLALVARELPSDRVLRKQPAMDESVPNAVRLVDAIDALPKEAPALIIIDDLVGEQAAYDLFGRLRDRLWSLPHVWIAAARPGAAGALRTPPADAFWSQIVEVPEMSGDEIDDLLKRGLNKQEVSVLRDTSIWPVRATPRSVVRWAQDMLDDPIGARASTETDRTAGLPRQAAMALAELDAMGRPASASDAELLKRLGWSRPYAARWLAYLEREGFARSFHAASSGQGRPPKLYEPA